MQSTCFYISCFILVTVPYGAFWMWKLHHKIKALSLAWHAEVCGKKMAVGTWMIANIAHRSWVELTALKWATMGPIQWWFWAAEECFVGIWEYHHLNHYLPCLHFLFLYHTVPVYGVNVRVGHGKQLRIILGLWVKGKNIPWSALYEEIYPWVWFWLLCAASSHTKMVTVEDTVARRSWVWLVCLY